VKFSSQVASVLTTLHPGVRRDIRRQLDHLDNDRPCDKKPLKGNLTGFHRLRIGKYRIIYSISSTGEAIAEFIGERNTVYDTFIPPPN
jgi:mRNA interferase RelE/StbE